jgi:hypothetical protein
MKFQMLLFFVSLALAQVTSVALSIDGSNAVESTGMSSFPHLFPIHFPSLRSLALSFYFSCFAPLSDFPLLLSPRSETDTRLFY